MNLISVYNQYIDKMLSETLGMKALLLDAETVKMISLISGQTKLMEREVYLIDLITNKERDKLLHLKCIVFIRPTPESIGNLSQELCNPHYGEYSIYFSNVVKNSHLEQLAQSDEFELVKEVQEIYADYFSVNPDLFSLETFNVSGDSMSGWNGDKLQRTVEGLTSICLSLRVKPAVRYERASMMSSRLAAEVNYVMDAESPLFSELRSDAVLLVVDRKLDIATALLNQWTYQAMIHELLGIQNGRVLLPESNEIKEELRQVSLNYEQDEFYKLNLFVNYGELNANIKNYVDGFQSKSKIHRTVVTISDMKRFLEDYPEFRKQSANVSKHFSIVWALNRIVEDSALLKVSEVEQEIVCAPTTSRAISVLSQALSDHTISKEAKQRLVLIYVAQYFDAHHSQLIEYIMKYNLTDSLRLIEKLKTFQELNYTKEVSYDGSNKVQKESENVYTQHQPEIIKILENLLKIKLKESLFPFAGNLRVERPSLIILFMVNGVTFEESKHVNDFNMRSSKTRIIIGGTGVMNSRHMMAEL